MRELAYGALYKRLVEIDIRCNRPMCAYIYSVEAQRSRGDRAPICLDDWCDLIRKWSSTKECGAELFGKLNDVQCRCSLILIKVNDS